MKVHLRLDNSEDADPASRAPLGDMLSAADGVLSAALEKLARPGTLPPAAEISVTLLSLEEMEEDENEDGEDEEEEEFEEVDTSVPGLAVD